MLQKSIKSVVLREVGRVSGDAGPPYLRSTVALSARERTTALSATLLACAARGEGVPEFRSMLSGVADGNADVIEQSLSLLLRLGETSGEGLVLGAQLALQSLES